MAVHRFGHLGSCPLRLVNRAIRQQPLLNSEPALVVGHGAVAIDTLIPAAGLPPRRTVSASSTLRITAKSRSAMSLRGVEPEGRDDGSWLMAEFEIVTGRCAASW